MAKVNLEQVGKALNTAGALVPQIQTAMMLVELGITTVQAVRGFFQSQGHDEETLDWIVAECDKRIARRS